MRRELTSQEIIRVGRAHAALAKWERARAFALALYGPMVARLTYSHVTIPTGDHHLRTAQVLAFDAAGRFMPYEFTASWWAARDLSESLLASAQQLTQDDLALGLGGSLPDELRDGLRDGLRGFAEERLDIETLHTWQDDQSDTPTWTFDLTAPPLLPYGEVSDADEASLASADITAAGLEREGFVRWAGAREYVHTLYGERAVRADVTEFSRYNDNTFDRDVRLGVFDAAGGRLPYDLRLSWWERFAFSEQDIARYLEEFTSNGGTDPEFDDAFSFMVDERAGTDIRQLATALLGVDFVDTMSPWDRDTVRYDLTRPPLLRFQRLWGQIDDA